MAHGPPRRHPSQQTHTGVLCIARPLGVVRSPRIQEALRAHAGVAVTLAVSASCARQPSSGRHTCRLVVSYERSRAMAFFPSSRTRT